MKKYRVKRILALLLTLVMLLGTTPVGAFAKDVGHTHDDSCYTDVQELTCTLTESTGHLHSDACYCLGGEMICIEAEDSHTHESACYCPGGELVCTIAESVGHSHNADCYTVIRVLNCDLEETESTLPLTEEELITHEDLESDEEPEALPAVLGRDIISFENSNPMAELEAYVGDSMSEIALPQSICAVVGFEEGELSFTADMPQTLPQGYSLPDGATLYEIAVGGQTEYRVYGTVNGEHGWFACNENSNDILGMICELPLNWDTSEVNMAESGIYTVSSYVAGYSINCDAPTVSIHVSDKELEESEASPIEDNSIDPNRANGIEYIDTQREMVFSLLGTEGGATPTEGADAWIFRHYYVKYISALATEKTESVLHMLGNNSTAKQTVKYQLEFHNDTDYAAGEVSIRIPYALYTDRNGNPVNPSDIGVPVAPAESPVCAFNYTIETVDGKDYFVFTNFRSIFAGSNNLIQVFYSLDDMMTIDGTTWEIPAEITVRGVTTQSNRVLVGSMDTDTELRYVTKQPHIIPNSSMYPELYTWSQLKSWSNLEGEEPEWFNDYRYVVWKTRITGRANQPWDLVVTDTPSHDGEVIAQEARSPHYHATGLSFPQDGDTLVLSKRMYGLLTNEDNTIDVYSVVRYPLSSFPEDNKVSNHIEVTLTGVDDQLEHTLSSDASHVWEDYHWSYSGDLISAIKSYDGISLFAPTPVEEGWIDVFQLGCEQGVDTPLPEKWRISGLARGYSQIIENATGSYTFHMVDDLQYARRSDGTFTLLTPDDYYYMDIQFTASDFEVDIYEDKTFLSDTGSPLKVYVMTADNRGTWQLVEEVSYPEITGFQIPDDLYQRGIYRIMVEHQVNCYHTNLSMEARTVVRKDSPLICAMTEDPTVKQILITNTAAGFATTDGGVIGSSSDTGLGGELLSEIDAFDQANYGISTYRTRAEVKLTRLDGTNRARKQLTYINNPRFGRADLTYSIEAYDGYLVYSQSGVNALAAQGISPARDSVKFYDLLPQGVVFDPAKPVTIGRIRGNAGSVFRSVDIEPASWNQQDMQVDWSVEDNYRGSGRQMVTFTLHYTGEREYEYWRDSDVWGVGWGVSFGAYVPWEDYALAKAGENVVAFATDTPIRGDGYIDDGTGVPTSVGSDSAGHSYYYDPEEDGIAQDPYLIYARCSSLDEIAVATKATIDKTVREDSNLFDTPAYDTMVSLGSTYTYSIMVSNATGILRDIVIFDKLENAIQWHGANDRREFEEIGWQGTFLGVDVTPAVAKGAAPVVYYSADIDQATDLAEPGWVLASAWTAPLSEVRAVAVDLSKNASGEDFYLEDIDSVRIRIKMQAPDVMQTPATYAYNSSAFYSVYSMEDGSESLGAIVLGNSTSVALYPDTEFSVEKALENAEDLTEEFAFTVLMGGKPYANREYKLFDNGVRVPGIHSTDEQGRLFLKGGQKAIFSHAYAGVEYEVTEERLINWLVEEGNVQSGVVQEEGTNLVFINRQVSALYFEKRVSYEQDYFSGNETLFSFRLTIDGVPAGNVIYDLVNPEIGVYKEPEIIQSGLVTGPDGSFSLKAGQRVVFTADKGSNYRFEEYDIPQDYTCEDTVAEGTINNRYALASITNRYKYKDLYVSKTVEYPEGVEGAEPSPAFSFVAKINGVPMELEYILYELVEDPDTGISEYAEIERGTTGADGTFTLYDRQQIRLIKLPAEATYEVQELIDESMPYRVYSPASGTVSGVLPKNAPNVKEAFVNRSTLRTLEIGKSVITTMDVSDTLFTFQLMVNGELCSQQPFVLSQPGEEDVSATTDENGCFSISTLQKARFTGLPVGAEIRIHEVPQEGFVQLYPQQGEDYVGLITEDFSIQTVTFTNLDENASGMLIVRKDVVSDIPGLAEASKYGRASSYSSYGTGVYGDGISYTFNLKVNGEPYAGEEFIRVAADGTITHEETNLEEYIDSYYDVATYHPGDFEIRATDFIIFPNLSEGDSYSLTEHYTVDTIYEDRDFWGTWNIVDPVTGKKFAQYVKIRQLSPEYGTAVEGVIDGSTAQIGITNILEGYVGLNVEKAIDNTNVWEDEQQIKDGALPWGSVRGKIWFRLQLRDSEGNIITGPHTGHFPQYGGRDELCTRPDEEGYFYMLIDNNLEDYMRDYGPNPYSFYGELDGYVLAGYDVKLEEVRTEPDGLFGELAGVYYDQAYYVPDEDGFISWEALKDSYGMFIYFANMTDRFVDNYRVYKELGDNEAGDENKDFIFTLLKSDPFKAYYDWTQPGRKSVLPLTYSKGANEPYKLYNTEDNSCLGDFFTDENGVFTLKAGQYAEFEGRYHQPVDDFYELDQKEECKPHYRIVESSYPDYTPQITVDKDGSGITTVSLGSTATLLAGGSVIFRNTYGQSSSLIVEKNVTAPQGAVIPADDEFIFTLKVDGTPYKNEKYTLFGSDGAPIPNIQMIDGFEVELPWTTDRYGEFTLKAGQRAVFDWIGAGRSYEVSEAEKQGYTQVTPAAGTSLLGVMTEEGAVASFTNHYAGMTALSSITVSKTIALPNGIPTGPEETFTYRISVAGQPYVMKEYALYALDGRLLDGELNTNFNGEFTLSGGQYAVFKDIPIGVDYEVEELLSEGSLYTLIQAKNTEGATTEDGVQVTFTNGFGNLLVEKKVTSVTELAAPEDDVFAFTLTVNGIACANKDFWIYSSNGTKLREETTDANGTFYLAQQEQALFFGIPMGSSYTVAEDGKRFYTQTVPVSADGYSGVIGPSAPKLTFVNEYERLASLEISKTTVDENGAPYDCNDIFTFQVTIGLSAYANKEYVVYGADGYKKPGVYFTSEDGTLTLQTGECAVFSGILPLVPYTVEEIAVPANFTPEDGKQIGLLGINGSALEFVNVYKNASGALKVSKTVIGNAGITDKEFTFTVTLGDTDINGMYGEMFFENGVAVFTLSSGESIIAEGLPAGVSYSVQESGNDGYEVTTEGSSANGTIVSEETLHVIFINNKNFTIDTGISLDSLPYILILAIVAGGGIAWVIIRKRKRKDR